MADHEQGGDRRGLETIPPASVRPGTVRTDRQGQPRQPRWRNWLVAGALALLIVALLGVLFWLPERVRAPQPPPAADRSVEEETAVDGSPTNGSPPEPAVDADKALAQRDAAERARGRARDRVARLRERAPGRWAGAEYQALQETLRQADRAFEARAYEQAVSDYREAAETAEALLKRGERRLSQALERGEQALKGGDAEAAAQAFELALAISPDNERAKQGAARAETLDRVNALIERGARQAQAGELEAARQSYREALSLDDAAERARDGLERVETRLADRRLRRMRREGFDALEAADYERALQRLRAAAEMAPGSEAVAQGIAEAEAGLQAERIETLRAAAREHEAEARWDEAVATYEKILAIDDTLAFAREALARARPRAELDRRLSAHLERPERLRAAAVREEVRQLLARARAVESAGPRLRDRIERLSQHLAEAAQPVPVTLVSDGETEVVVNRVGNLGRFERKRIELTPGEYTAVGRRSGHRSERVTFRVEPGGENGPFAIRAGEPI